MYKIIKDNKVIDAIKYADFIRFMPAGHRVRTSKELAQGVLGSNNRTIYSFVPIDDKTIPVVTIKEIDLKEFNRLQSLLNSGKEIPGDESALAQAKRDTLKRLSSVCKKIITAGFSIKLSDGKIYKFRLTTEDQLNLMNIENQLNAGAKTFVYHATDLPCQIFNCDDMCLILRAFRKHTLYHTTYFNAAKQYINSLTDIEKVNLFNYGTNITDTVKDLTLRQILKQGSSVE